MNINRRQNVAGILVCACLATIASFVRVDRAESTPNQLVNSGAETGDVSGWIFSGNSSVHADNGAFDSGISPLTGSFDFVGGIGSVGVLSQSLTLSPYLLPFQMIDTGSVTLQLSFAEQSLAENPLDTATIIVSGYNAAASQVSSYTDPNAPSVGGWSTRGSAQNLAASARSIVYAMLFTRNSGVGLDAFIDNNSMTYSYNGSAWNGSANDHSFANAANWNTGVPLAAAAAVLTRASGSDFINYNGNYVSGLSFLVLDAPGGMTLNQSANVMTASVEVVGGSGAGVYNQSGGANTVGTLSIGANVGGVGTYNLTGGTLTAATISVGVAGGGGTLALAGGRSIPDFLQVGSSSRLLVSAGFHTLNGLTISSSASVSWTGGTLEFRSGVIGSNALVPQTATFSGNQSAMFEGSTPFSINGMTGTAALVIGFSGPGSFTQSGTGAFSVGSNVSSNNIYLAGASGTSSYTLNNPAASLYVSSLMYVGGTDSGDTNTGVFNIFQGSANIGGIILGSNGFVNLAGGSLTTGFILASPRPSALNWSGGTLNILSDFIPSRLLGSGSLTLNGAQSANFTGSVGEGNSSFTFNNLAFLVGGTTSFAFTQNGTGAITVGTPAQPRNMEIATTAISGANTYTLSNAATSLVVNGNLYFGGFDTAAGNISNANTLTLFAGTATVTGVLKLWSPGVLNLVGGALNVAILDLTSHPTHFNWTGGNFQLLGGSLFGATSITVPPSGTLSGSGSIFTAITLNGTINASIPFDELAIHGITSGTGNVVVTANAAIISDALRVNALTLNPGGSATLRAGAGASRLNLLAIPGLATAPAAKLDIRDNALILTYTTAPNGAALLATTYKQIIAARGTQDVNGISNYAGNGITSATAAANNLAAGFDQFSIGAINNADLAAVGINAPYTTFGGLSGISANSILVRYSYSGDINLDGKVNIDDYNYIDAGFGGVLAGFSGQIIGDFNNDGKVNIDDYNVIDAGFSFQGAPLTDGDLMPLEPFSGTAPDIRTQSVFAVPEPSTLLVMFPIFVTLISVKRRFHTQNK